MSGFTVEFAFEIGQQVFFRCATNNRDTSPKPYTVWERLAVECHGGVQRCYHLGRATDLQFVPEIALTSERPPYDITLDGERRLAWERSTKRETT